MLLTNCLKLLLLIFLSVFLIVQKLLWLLYDRADLERWVFVCAKLVRKNSFVIAVPQQKNSLLLCLVPDILWQWVHSLTLRIRIRYQERRIPWKFIWRYIFLKVSYTSQPSNQAQESTLQTNIFQNTFIQIYCF